MGVREQRREVSQVVVKVGDFPFGLMGPGVAGWCTVSPQTLCVGRSFTLCVQRICATGFGHKCFGCGCACLLGRSEACAAGIFRGGFSAILGGHPLEVAFGRPGWSSPMAGAPTSPDGQGACRIEGLLLNRPASMVMLRSHMDWAVGVPPHAAQQQCLRGGVAPARPAWSIGAVPTKDVEEVLAALAEQRAVAALGAGASVTRARTRRGLSLSMPPWRPHVAPGREVRNIARTTFAMPEESRLASAKCVDGLASCTRPFGERRPGLLIGATSRRLPEKLSR